MALEVDSHRLSVELAALATYSATPSPAITRVVFSEPDQAARSWLKGILLEAHLEIREDAVGNLFARWQGSAPTIAAVGTGSHIDAIPNSGQYDGTVGVLGGLEAIRSLQRSGFRPRRSIELLLFTAEEPTRFGIGCLGSRLLSGGLSDEADQRLVDRDGNTLQVARLAAGYKGPLNSVKLTDDYYDSFVELHIEQGPLLEAENLSIGAVTNIAAPASIRIVVEGEGGHAGAVLMPYRRDAFVAAAEIALAVEAAAKWTGAEDTVGTTGVCHVFPGAVNSIPSRVTLEIDVRDTNAERRDEVLERLNKACESIAAQRRVSITREVINADAPAQCDARIVETITAACVASGKTFRKMVSRAYHDSLFMSRIAPTSMLFIPCRAGVSHRPDEYADPRDIANGVHVLAETLARLSA